MEPDIYSTYYKTVCAPHLAPLKKRIYYPRYGYVYSPRVNLWPTDHGFNVVARVYVAFG